MTITRCRAPVKLALVMTLLTSAACIPSIPDAPTNPNRIDPVVLVHSGSENGGWRAWIYRTGTGQLCLEVRGVDGDGVRCGQGGDALEGPGTQVSERATFVLGGTRIAAAASVKVVMADNSTASGPIVEATRVAGGLRVYVVPVSPTSEPVAVDVVDTDGKVVESSQLRD